MKLSIIYNELGKRNLLIDGQGDTLIVQESLDLDVLTGIIIKDLNIRVAGFYGTCGSAGNTFSPSAIKTTTINGYSGVTTPKQSFGTSSGNGPLDATAGTDGSMGS